MADLGIGPAPVLAISRNCFQEAGALSVAITKASCSTQGASTSGSEEELAAQAMSRNLDSKGIAEAASQIDDRAVVLGFAMSIDEFRQVEDALREDFDPWVEVSLNPQKSPFKPTNLTLTPDVVDSLSARYRG